jgi:hypothetical protein
MRIIVNGRPIHTNLVTVSYEEIVALAGHSGNPSAVYSSKRDGDVRRQGAMYSGCSPVLLTDVMTFDVAHTGAA